MEPAGGLAVELEPRVDPVERVVRRDADHAPRAARDLELARSRPSVVSTVGGAARRHDRAGTVRDPAARRARAGRGARSSARAVAEQDLDADLVDELADAGHDLVGLDRGDRPAASTSA